MANGRTSRKLAAQTYPALQEFLEKLTGIVAEKGYQPLLDDTAQSILSPKDRRQLFNRQRSSMADVLNQLHCPVDSAEFEDSLSPEARIILRSVTGSAPYFASLFLPFFYEDSLLLKLANSKKSIDDLFNKFCTYVSQQPSSSYSSLNKVCKDIKNEKACFKDISRSLGTDLKRKTVIVHRVSTVDQSQVGKRIVIDPQHPELFPLDNYVHLSLQTSHVIEPMSSDSIEYHILVKDNCRYGDDELVIMSKVGIHQDAPWYVGTVIFNVYETTPLYADFVRSSHSKLLQNSNARTPVNRSDVRQGSRIDRKTKMVAMGDIVDQNGWVRTPQNLGDIPKSILDGEDVSDVKPMLMRIADSVLDGFIKVSSHVLLPFLTCARLLPNFFHLSSNLGWSILLHTELSHQVYDMQHWVHTLDATMRRRFISMARRLVLLSAGDALLKTQTPQKPTCLYIPP